MNRPVGVLAIDVGGTAIKAVILDDRGRPLASHSEPTPVHGDPDAAVEALRRVARKLAETEGVTLLAAGVVVPGSVDRDTGVARYAANIGWRDVPVGQLVRSDLGVPVALDHDVRAAAVAELVLGRAVGVADCTIVVIGTGIAAVSVAGGHEVRGATGHAGELGHVPVRPGGEPCACGQRGCLEVYASAGAIAQRYQARTGHPATSRQLAAVIDSDPVAAAIWAEAVDAFADALVTVVMLDDPSMVVLSGGLAEAGDVLLAPLRRAVADRIAWRSAPLIELSPLGARAGRLGAAVLAWRTVGKDDFAGWPPDAWRGDAWDVDDLARR